VQRDHRFYLDRLTIEAVRNLQTGTFELHPGLNGFVGENGAGKTSVLEAVHLLGAGRSFRTHNSQDYIRHNENCALISARLVSDAQIQQLGMQRCRQKILLKHNGEQIERLSDFIRLLPVLTLHPGSDALVSGSPDHRRRFIDRGVFHAIPAFGRWFGRYQRLLKQRNAALKQRHDERLWESGLIEAAEHIESMRREFVDKLQEIVEKQAQIMDKTPEVELHYQPGYRQEMHFADALGRSRQRDRDLGSTQVGPHRANLVIRYNGHDADSTASRGQIKTLVSLLTLGTLVLWRETYDRIAVVLFDDLPSELDREHFDYLVDWLKNSGHQALITAVEPSALTSDMDRLFSVKQGFVRELL